MEVTLKYLSGGRGYLTSKNILCSRTRFEPIIVECGLDVDQLSSFRYMNLLLETTCKYDSKLPHCIH